MKVYVVIRALNYDAYSSPVIDSIYKRKDDADMIATTYNNVPNDYVYWVEEYGVIGTSN